MTGAGGASLPWLRAARRPRLRQRVLFTLVLAAVAAALGLAFVTVAPNRLLSGQGVSLFALRGAAVAGFVAVVAALALAAWLPPTRALHAVVALHAAAALAALVWLAGDEAWRRSAGASSFARTSFGGGFWALALLAWLAAADALQRLGLSPIRRAAAHAAVLLPLAALMAGGSLDALSLAKEYANRRDVFEAAAWRHAQIVGATLLPALAIGVPLGIVTARHERHAARVFALLNAIQTVPSIALFGLLIAPLAWLGDALPSSGIRGIGLLPAVIALTLYALLPIVHGVVAGLRQVPADAVAAATGMGMTPRQRFWQVELPLALPVWLSGLRVTVVTLIGLAVVAALIGAGGFGAIMFQGLLGSALDLVMLGVLPVVALAIGVDALLRVLADVLAGALAGAPAGTIPGPRR